MVVRHDDDASKKKKTTTTKKKKKQGSHTTDRTVMGIDSMKKSKYIPMASDDYTVVSYELSFGTR